MREGQGLGEIRRKGGTKETEKATTQEKGDPVGKAIFRARDWWEFAS